MPREEILDICAKAQGSPSLLARAFVAGLVLVVDADVSREWRLGAVRHLLRGKKKSKGKVIHDRT